VRPQDSWNGAEAGDVVISVRPEKIQVGLNEPSDQMNCYEGRLKHVMYLGTHVHYVVELLTGESLTVLQPNRPESLIDLHTPVHVYWSAADCLALAT
jgi:spermidine/putrescine transport system ATP-binding protein